MRRGGPGWSLPLIWPVAWGFPRAKGSVPPVDPVVPEGFQGPFPDPAVLGGVGPVGAGDEQVEARLGGHPAEAFVLLDGVVEGVRPKVRDRRAAESKARASILGLTAGAAGFTLGAEVAARIVAEATAEETKERDIVETAAREDGVLDDDLT